MKNIICLLFLILIGCDKSECGKNVNTENSAAKKVSYNDFLRSVKNKSETEKKNYFFTFINYDVPNYWMVHLGHLTEQQEIRSKKALHADILSPIRFLILDLTSIERI